MDFFAIFIRDCSVFSSASISSQNHPIFKDDSDNCCSSFCSFRNRKTFTFQKCITEIGYVDDSAETIARLKFVIIFPYRLQFAKEKPGAGVSGHKTDIFSAIKFKFVEVYTNCNIHNSFAVKYQTNTSNSVKCQNQSENHNPPMSNLTCKS